MAQTTQKIYYSLREVRELFGDGISESSLLTMVRRGDIPARRMMNRIFVPQWWVQQLISEATKQPMKEEIVGGQ